MTSDVRQPMARPATVGEYLAMRPRMIDTHGRPLRLGECARCGREHFTVEPCAHEAPCLRCGATASRCRPSEHEADAWHAERVAAFEALCAEREAAGLPQVARWPDAAAPACSTGQRHDPCRRLQPEQIAALRCGYCGDTFVCAPAGAWPASTPKRSSWDYTPAEATAPSPCSSSRSPSRNGRRTAEAGEEPDPSHSPAQT